ncbi:type IV pilus secretin family protein [Desulfonema magnum]|uniref:Fimbrial assembly protein, PilQ-like n=1 Tax=Desulfonema magnum TaxID=45655 RepID=A0A975BNM8_9BACT|nr:type IV pilus secretin family protein [Desulfonema magnum]QTA88592.1 Putative fimbrial assembly protein, PilQ-like [Desulfonema magnum]
MKRNKGWLKTNFEYQVSNIKFQVSNIKFQIIFLLISSLIFAGCASNVTSRGKNEGAEKVSQLRMITGISLSETSESVNVLVKGNQSLTYTSVKQPIPLAVILYFSETGLDTSADQTDIPGSGLIRSLKASELTQNGRTSRIEILLEKDISYDISREGTGIKISFVKTADEALPGFFQEDADRVTRPPRSPESLETSGISPAVPEPETRRPELEIWDPKLRAWVPASGTHKPQIANRKSQIAAMPTATRLQSVYATQLKDSLKVFVGADGAITNYKVFTIASPARIVFDIFNVRSPYSNEKRVAVNSEWVKQVRYFGYSDRVRLVLDTKKPYLSAFWAYPVEAGLEIFVGAQSDRLRAESKRTMEEAYSPKSGVKYPEATRLQSVYATQMEDSIIITVRGDGAITDYKASAVENPPSIVFDIFNVRGLYEEHEFPVDSKWIKRVRYNSYPDKLRLFIDTQKAYLSAFSAHPDKNGLVIQVGKTDSRSRSDGQVSGTMPSDVRSGLASSPESGKPASVDLIVFVPEDAGKSSLVLETSRQVRYDITETADKKLRLVLFNARIPEYRYKQGPLLTKRFETAVDQIVPVQKPGANTSVFEIDLREAVPYFIEQTDESGENLLMVHFEASSISPGPVPGFSGPEKIKESTIADASRFPEPEPQTPEAEVRASGPRYVDTPPATDRSAGADMGTDHQAPVVSEMPPAGAGSVRTDIQPPPAAPRYAEGPDTDDEITIPDVTEKYTGEKIALDFFDTDIRNVFRILREVSGKNFAIDGGVKGKVTLSLQRPVPWDQVLDLVLKMNQLGKTFEGDIIRIATVKTLQQEEKLRQEKILEEQSLKEQKKALDPLLTEYIAVSYSDAASEIMPHIKNVLTKDRGTVTVDKRTNMVIITDTDEAIRKAKGIVAKLDRVTPQVIIEARIVEANSNFAKEIGTEWGLESGIQEGDTNAGIGPQRSYDLLGGTYGYNMAVNLPPGANLGSIGLNFTRIAGTPFLLNAKLMAMESQEEGKIITAPRILTLDNKPATISQGFEYPYQTTDDSGETTTKFKKVDLNLDVTPHITPDNRISMKLSISKNDVYVQTEEGPALTTKTAKTELLVNDGDTIVIGGIIRTEDTEKTSGIPGLSKIPLIGWLFKTDKDTEVKQELLIFITPRIVQLEQRHSQY